MSKQTASPFLCETDNLGASRNSDGTLTIQAANSVTFNSDSDVENIQVGSIIQLEPSASDDNEYRIIQINARTKGATVHKDIEALAGTYAFTYWRVPLSIRQRSDDGSGGYDEFLRSYIKEDGSFHTDEAAQSGCLLSGKNAASQSLTTDVYTLVQWDNSLIWTNPQNEWTNDGANPNFFVPRESGYYSIWASFSVFSTSSSVGNEIQAYVSLDGWADEYIAVVHQRPDLDFITTYRRNIDLQCFALVAAGQALGIYVTSGCAVSEISNSYTMHFAAWRLGDSYVTSPEGMARQAKEIAGRKPHFFK